MGQSTIKNSRRIFTTAGGDPSLPDRVIYLENNEYKILYFQSISAATGTITKPTNSTILLDQFYEGGDAIVETLVNGQPSEQSPVTAGGAVVSVSSFDASGNYTLSGTPSSYPVALVYILKIKAVDYQNLVTANIMAMESIEVRNDVDQYAVTSGTDTYTATPNPALASYLTGAQVTLNFGNTNTGASTINLNGLGAKSIITPDGLALTGGELLGIMTLVYDGTSFQILGGSGAGGGAASDLFNYYNFM